MAKYVFVSDPSLSREYNNFPLLDFLPCAPTSVVPEFLYNFLKGRRTPDDNGKAILAPYALRKLESALLAKNKREDVVIAHENFAADFVKDDTEIIGVYTMDPLGLAPLTMSFSLLFGEGRYESKPWVRVEFERLIAKLNRAKQGKKAKLVVGGPGVWELTMMPELLPEMGIDYAFQGEADDIINEVLEDLAGGSIYDKGYFQGFQSFDTTFHKTWVAHDRFVSRVRSVKQFPTLDDIPLIQGPTVKGLSEVMRGCGIGCDFCEVTLRPIRYYKPETVKKEVEVNARYGKTSAWLHSDEIFAYQHGPHFTPNREAIKDLFQTVMSVKGLTYANPTHGRISIPAGYPEVVRDVSSAVGAGPDKWIGVQVGLETGSDRLAEIHMPNKTLPLKIGPDGTWQQIVAEGVKQMNLRLLATCVHRAGGTDGRDARRQLGDGRDGQQAERNGRGGWQTIRVHGHADAERGSRDDKEQVLLRRHARRVPARRVLRVLQAPLEDDQARRHAGQQGQPIPAHGYVRDSEPRGLGAPTLHRDDM